MSLRLKLLAVFIFTVAASVGLMAWGVERYARRQFQESDQQRSDALVTQFRSELSQRGAEVSSRVQSIADAESTLRMVMDLNRPQADPSVYANDARGLASSRQLDFLDLVGGDGKLISSAQWPERVGYKNDWVTQPTDWNKQDAFLDRVDSPDKVSLGLLAVRVVHVGERSFYIIGGQRLDSDFLRTLALPAGMRALFYRNLEEAYVPAALSDAQGPLADADAFAPLIESLQKSPRGSEQTVAWTAGPGGAERFVALPLPGRRGELQGVLLLGSAQGQLLALVDYIRGLALAIGAAGILIGFLLSWWVSARVTRPLAKLAGGIEDVAAGDLDTRVEVRSGQEIGKVVRAFNSMTVALADDRVKQQAQERVSAWRQLARQLAGELNAALSPLQKAVVNLGQAREQTPERFDEVFFESLAALREELGTLRAAVGYLNDFASIPEPRLQAVRVNDVVRAAVISFETRFSAIGRPPITPELYLDEKAGPVRADLGLLRKAIENLLLHSIEDMPAGGTLTIRTRQQDGMVHVVMSDTGLGSELPGGSSMFSPGRGGTRGTAGLGLATVQSIVSDIRGRFLMESAPGAGTTFYLDIPMDAPVPAGRPNSQPQQALPEPKPQHLDIDREPVHETIPEIVPASMGALPLKVESEVPAEIGLPIHVESTAPELTSMSTETQEELQVEAQHELFLQASPGVPPEVAAQLLAGLSAGDVEDEIAVTEPQAAELLETPPPSQEQLPENPPEKTLAETEDKETWPPPLTYR